jgi:exodeoxyribonuclease V alpha subunit
MPATKTTETKKNLLTIKGRLARVFAERETWFAGNLELEDGEKLSINGPVPSIPPIGSELELEGQHVDGKYGPAFRFERCQIVLPSTRAGAVEFLKTCPGIGPKRAEKIVDVLGPEAVSQVMKEPDILAKAIPGFTGRMAAAVAGDLEGRFATIGSERQLCDLGFGSGMRKRIFEHFKDRLPRVLALDPYALVEVDLVSFHRLDTALMQIDPTHADKPGRAAAAVVQALKDGALEGHTWLAREQLDEALRKLKLTVAIPAASIAAGLEAALKGGAVSIVREGGYALTWLANAEAAAARILAKMLRDGPPPITGKDPAGYEELTDEQKAATRHARRHGVSIITGGPGTGKTHTTRVIMEALGREKLAIVAPTGKAAKRAAEVTGHEQAMTVHRFLKALENGAPMPESIIVDEFSMVDIELLFMLLNALNRKCRLVIVGDVDQLPSVGPGRALADLILSGVVPTTRLSRVMRQAQESRIVSNAHAINNGAKLDHTPAAKEDWFLIEPVEGDPRKPADQLADKIPAAVARLAERWSLDPFRDIQVLTGQRRGKLGVNELNERLRERFNPSRGTFEITIRKNGAEVSLFRQGDKVLVTKNDAELGVVNGDVGIVTQCLPERKTKTEEGEKTVPACAEVGFDDGRVVRFYDGKTLQTLTQAWAMTVHKSQGSEYPVCLVVCHESLHWSLQRCLLYTAVTRAKQRLIMVGSRKAIAMAVKNDTPTIRYTRLTGLLRGEVKANGAEAEKSGETAGKAAE